MYNLDTKTVHFCIKLYSVKLKYIKLNHIKLAEFPKLLKTCS